MIKLIKNKADSKEYLAAIKRKALDLKLDVVQGLESHHLVKISRPLCWETKK
jgi:hypothetical protein